MLDPLLQTIILGLIQGFAEWLPISSTAHLRIAEHFLGLTVTPFFGVALHVGTLIVVIFYFRTDIRKILSALVHWDFGSEYGHFIPLIVVGTVPTAVIGLLYVTFLEDTLQTIMAIGITLLAGATLVYVSKFGKDSKETITYTMALIMGTAQGFAIFPGLSRSGATISFALLLGLKREKAFRFSFLLSIPAILGDFVVEAYKQRGQLATEMIGTTELLIGIIVAMISGYVAIRLVQKTVASKKFYYFAAYTAVLGVVLIALALNGF